MRKKDSISSDSVIADSLQRMRIEIVDATSTIGTYVPELKTATEAFQTEMLGAVSRFEASIEDVGAQEQELLSIDALYRPVAPEGKSTSALRIYEILHKYGKYPKKALASYDDEGIREHEMTLFHPMVFEFDYMPVSDNFRDIVTALKLALNSNSSRPFTRPQITILIKVIDKLKHTVDVSDAMMDEIIDLLAEHFDLAGPLAEGVFLE
jgi:hypothetical protein